MLFTPMPNRFDQCWAGRQVNFQRPCRADCHQLSATTRLPRSRSHPATPRGANHVTVAGRLSTVQASMWS